MKTRMSWIGAVLAAVAVPVWAHCGFCGKGEEKGEAHEHAEVGKAAPDFALNGADGKEYKLSDFEGKVVVLEWINHECPVVNRYHKSGFMSSTQEKFEGKPVVWLAIDSSHFCKDKLDNIKKWIEEESVETPYLLDPSGAVGHEYGAKTTPHVFVIDQKGTLAYAGAPDNDPYGKQSEEETRNYVAEAVDSLLKGSTVATKTTKPFGCSVKYKG